MCPSFLKVIRVQLELHPGSLILESTCSAYHFISSIPWEPGGNEDSQAPLRPTASESAFQQAPQVIHIHITLWEALVYQIASWKDISYYY